MRGEISLGARNRRGRARLTRRTLLGGLVFSGVASSGGDEKVWRDYVGWYRALPSGVSDTRAAYFEHLRRRGVSDDEVQARARVIDRLIEERREELRPFFFDRTYANPTPRFNTEPNALLKEAVRELKPGRALDIHMGQGRNAVFLASKGWDVTGFDFSEAGIRAARAAAAAAGVNLTALVRRHEDFDFGRARWDLIVMTYTWLPLTPGQIDRVLESLNPGGIVVFEHLMDESGSDRAAPWLPRPNQLLSTFGRLRILRYEDVWDSADWSWRPERIARLVARK